MSSIASLGSNAYYQLSDPSAGTGSSSTNSTSALLQALGTSSDSQASSASSDAYLLDLSPQALAMMNGSSSASSASADSPLGSSSESFTLTSQQQQTISTILEKYKDAPYTQATFDDIQNDLQAAGLDPTTLSRLDQAQSFNPTELFIDDLNGDYSDADAITQPDESAKSSNYMQQIISEWQQISGNTGDVSNSAATTDATSAASAS